MNKINYIAKQILGYLLLSPGLFHVVLYWIFLTIETDRYGEKYIYSNFWVSDKMIPIAIMTIAGALLLNSKENKNKDNADRDTRD